jgi:exosortase A-associated hydrolase 2
MQFARFIDSPNGRLFCSGYLQQESDTPSPTVLVLAPFGEELNKSRHVLSSIARELGELGCSVIMPDFSGTGDSEGDFGDASIERWRTDIGATLAAFPPGSSLHLVGLRFGGLLACDTTTRHAVASLNLLHPVVDGKQQLIQMLRLRLAGGITSGADKETMAGLQATLREGRSIEIAGYRLSSALAKGMAGLRMDNLQPQVGTVVRWFEIAPAAERPILPVSERVIAAWQQREIQVETEVIQGDHFWMTQEIADCAGLRARVVESMRGC